MRFRRRRPTTRPAVQVRLIVDGELMVDVSSDNLFYWTAYTSQRAVEDFWLAGHRVVLEARPLFPRL